MLLIPFLFLPLGAAPQGTAASSDASEPRPNIVFILVDDQRFDTISAHGYRAVHTPNIDRIVRSGTSFHRNYCLGSAHGAVCAPSRAMIHSGRAYHSIDHRGLTDVKLLGEALQERGYQTFGTGKWHNGQDSFKRSFQAGRAVFFGGMSNHFEVPIRHVDGDGVVSEPDKDRRHSSDIFSEAATGFLESVPREKPYFLSVALTAPHDPRDAPEEWFDRELPPLPVNFAAVHPFDNGFLTVRDEALCGWPREPEVVRRQLREYYGLIEHMDAAVGRILDAVESRGDAGRTYVVFAADHGLALGSHGLLGKQSVYEHSLRAPLIISGPGVPEAGHVTALTYLLDLYPTLLEVAGPLPAAPLEAPPEDTVPPADRPRDAPGERAQAVGGAISRSLAPLWRGEATMVRNSLFLAMGTSQRAVSDGRWKLCVYPQIGHHQLFDLASDPHEQFDLGAQPAFASHLERLWVELETWQERVGDPTPLTVEEPGPMTRDLVGRERKPDRWQPQWIRDTYFPKPADAGDQKGD